MSLTNFKPLHVGTLHWSLHVLLTLSLLSLLWISGCTTGNKPASNSSTDPHYPVGYMEQGIASWYGPGFHGNLTANGEQYDMYGITAAHRTLPLGSVLKVRSLTNGRHVTVRVNDRGPFAKDRILDLSLGAAEVLQMTQHGTDRISLKVIEYLGPLKASQILVIQVGSFRDKARAWALQSKLAGQYSHVRVVTVPLRQGVHYRVLVGKYRSEKKAHALADVLAKRFDLETLVIREDT